MNRLFVYLSSEYSYQQFLPLLDKLTTSKIIFLDNTQLFEKVSGFFSPGNLLIHYPDYQSISGILGNTRIFPQGVSVILVGQNNLPERSTKHRIRFLPEDFSPRDLETLLARESEVTGYTNLKANLRNEQYFLQMLMDNIPDTIYFKDRDSRFIRINKAQAKTLGITDPEEAIGKSDADFFEKEHARQAYIDEQELMQSGKPIINKLEYIKTSAGYRYVSATKVPLTDESGICTGMVGISRDVTNEQLAEQELMHEKELMNLLMDNIPDRIYFKDVNSRFIRANKALAQIFGLKNPEELYGKTDFDFHDPAHAEQAFRDEQELMKNGLPLVNKVESHIHNGETRWETSTKIPLFKNKELIGMVGISRDFTQQKILEEKLKKEKDLLQSLMDNVPDYIFFKDTGSRYIRINEALRKEMGLRSSDEIVGKTDADFFSPEMTDLFHNTDHDIFENGNASVNQIVETTFKNGRTLWLSTTKMPIRNDKNEIIGLVGISRDVTVQEMTRQSYRLAKEKAEEANKAKSLFLANMSHEIRTPMNGVIGMADILKRTNLDDVQREYLDIIMKSGQTLLSIINDILDFSKIESGKMELENIPVSIRNIVEEVADIQVFHANEKSIDLITFVDAGIPDFVYGDYVRLKQVITNLVNNAIKFTSKGEVYISVEHAGQSGNLHDLQFKVIDTGIGIPKEHQEKLFSSFTQVDNSTTRKYGGTGLGLAISQRLISAMGSEIVLRSEEGNGSEFSFVLRMKEAREEQPDAINLTNVSFKNLNVLIVDDNRTNRKIFREYLENWGVNVFEVSNGYDALKELPRMVADGIKIDIALVDYQMAGMDGIELAGKLKEDPALKAIRLIMLSSVTDAFQNSRTNYSGFEYYLNKPVKLKQLFNVIASIVGKPRQVASIDVNLESFKADFKNKRILIAEDNKINMQVAVYSLKPYCSNIFMAFDGKEAVEIFSKERVDYILMDVQMPVMNGIEATMQIRQIEKQTNPGTPVKIIAMTANTMREDVEYCLQIGMDAFLGKPFKVNDLMNVLIN